MNTTTRHTVTLTEGFKSFFVKPTCPVVHNSTSCLGVWQLWRRGVGLGALWLWRGGQGVCGVMGGMLMKKGPAEKCNRPFHVPSQALHIYNIYIKVYTHTTGQATQFEHIPVLYSGARARSGDGEGSRDGAGSEAGYMYS